VTEWARFVRPAVHDLEPYRPGRPTGDLVPLHRNEDLFPAFPGMRAAVEAELANVWMYPEEAYVEFRAAVAASLGTTADRIVPAHGAQALIGMLASLFLDPGDRVVVPQTTYALYAQASAARGATVHRVPLRELRLDLEALAAAATETSAKLVWVCDPNNPTGSLVERAEWAAFLEAMPATAVAVVDEAYADYVDPAARIGRVRDVEAGRPVVVVRTLSKLYGLAGLRLGYAVADPELARYLDVVHEPFGVNRAAIAAGLVCLADAQAADARRHEVREARDLLSERLRSAGARPLPSQTNFVLVDAGVDGTALAELLADDGLLVRPGGEYGLDTYVRITVGPVPLMERVADAVARALPRLAS
jgi:histidinol-phosphate aminotransferase